MASIRMATRKDVPKILEISNWAIRTPANFSVQPESLDSWIESYEQTHERHPWLVADQDGQGFIIGFAKSSPWKGRCAYDWAVETSVYIDPRFHRQGIGRKLYQRLFPLLRAQGYCTAIAGITVPNDASVGLHESFGMRRVALFESIGWKFDQWHDVGYWQVHLQSPDARPGAIRPVAEAVQIVVELQ